MPAGRAPEQRLTQDALRWFFAAWPDAATQRELGRWAQAAGRECGGRATRRENIHLTLVFLGNVAAARLDELKTAAAGIAGGCCELAVDRLGYWPHNRIVWAGTSVTPPSLESLAATLTQALATAGFAFDRRPYVPHVTLVRKARRAPSFAPRPLLWRVEEFALVRSGRDDRGSRYEVAERWRLARKNDSA